MRARQHRTPLQRVASSHNRLHYKLQVKVIGGLQDIAEAKTLTDESRLCLEEVHQAIARLKSSMRTRKQPEGMRRL